MNIANPTTCAVPTSTSSQNNGDPLGEFVQDTANPSLGHTTTYTYDHLNRLTSSVATPGQTGRAAHNLAFGYDRYGNMACVQNSNTNGPCGQWTFNAATNQITNTGFTYSYAGQLTNDGLHSYSWDAEGRLKQVDSGSTARYFYNALGWRVEKLVGSTYTEYLFGASGQPLGENNRSTTWAVSYVPLGFGAFALYENNATYFTHPNKIGSTAFVTDYTGAAVQDRIFYPWGQDWALGGTLYDERFASLRHRDTEAAFDPTPHRTYCSAYGRWLSPDPLGGSILNPQSLNRYLYAGDNPGVRTDSSGLCSLAYLPGDYPFGTLDYLTGTPVCNAEDGCHSPLLANAPYLGLPMGVGSCGGGGGGGGGGGPKFSNGPWGGTFNCNKSSSQVLSYLEQNFASLASTVVNYGGSSNIVSFTDPNGINPWGDSHDFGHDSGGHHRDQPS